MTQRQAAEVHSPSSEIPVKKSIPTPSNDPLPSGEDSIQLNELMIFCSSLQQQVLDLEEAKIAQAKEIAKLKKRVKKLEKRKKSRPAGLRRLKKGRMQDADMFGVDGLEVTAASVEDSAAPTTATTADVDDELTLAKTLIAIKAVKPKQKDFKGKRFDDIKKIFDKVYKRVNTFVDMDTENVEESLKKTKAKGRSKRVGQELEQESAKKQKLAEQEQDKVVDDDTTELKRCLEIVPEDDDDDVAIETTPLSSKSPTIVEYMIYREGKKCYFKIIRANGKLQNYLTFGTMFKNFNKEDLEVLRSIVKERFKKTKPVDDIENLLFQTLKTMFEPHVEDIIWKYQQGDRIVLNLPKRRDWNCNYLILLITKARASLATVGSVKNSKFTGRQDPHNHLRFFNKVTSTFRHPEVPNTTIKLLLFPFSLEGEARIWLDKELPRSILTWEDLVSMFINQFFPPSKTTYLRNEITNFLQKPKETFNEAWERFKDLFRQYPHHGFSELHQLDTFYNALNPNNQDALDSAAEGNFLDKIPRECLSIIESKSKVRYSRSRITDSRGNTNAPLSYSFITPTAPIKAFEEVRIMHKASKISQNRAISDTRFEVYIKSRINGHFSITIKPMKPICQKIERSRSILANFQKSNQRKKRKSKFKGHNYQISKVMIKGPKLPTWET
nr:reverse transcriptase domain-containing protein [Tanacetum cinerariifolium]